MRSIRFDNSSSFPVFHSVPTGCCCVSLCVKYNILLHQQETQVSLIICILKLHGLFIIQADFNVFVIKQSTTQEHEQMLAGTSTTEMDVYPLPCVNLQPILAKTCEREILQTKSPLMRLLAYTIKQWVISRLQRKSEQEMADNTDQSKISTTVAVYHFVITLKYMELSELSNLSELCIMYHQQQQYSILPCGH